MAVAPFSGAQIVGSNPLDWIWAAFTAGAASYIAATAKRGPLLLAAIAAVASSRSFTALIVAGVAVAAAAASTRNLRRRAVFARGLSGGATVVSLLCSGRDLSAASLLLAATVAGAAISISGLRHASVHDRRRAARVAVVLAGTCVLAAVAAVLGVVGANQQVDVGTVELRAGLSAARRGDVSGARDHLERAASALHGARSDVRNYGVLARAVPFAAQHVDALSSVLGNGEDVAAQASQVAGLADDDSLRVRSGRVDVDAVRELVGPLGRLAVDLDHMVQEIEARTSGPLLPPLRDRLDALHAQTAKALHEAELAADAAALVPDLLGAEDPRRYLVVFTSPAEARGRFGFPASYAEVTFTDGQLTLGEHGTSSAELSSIQVDQRPFDLGDPDLRPYVPYGPTRLFLSSTIPPDFPTAARLLAEIWEQNGRPAVDGVLRFDPTSLAALLRFTGPVSVPGRAEPLTPDNLEEYLLRGQYIEFPDDQAPRRELLGTVADLTFERLQSADLPAPRGLVSTFDPLVAEGHLDVVSFGRSAAQFLRRAGLDGHLAPPEGDGVLITNVNSIGNKIDSFLGRSVTYTGRVEGNQIRADLAVELRNEAPSRGLPFYVIGSSVPRPPPLGTNRTTLFAYTAAPISGAEIDGVVAQVNSERTGGWWLHQVVVELPAGSTRTVVFHVDGQLPAASRSLVLLPGGGTTPDEFAVDLTVDGRRLTYRGGVAAPTQLRPLGSR